MRASWSGLGLTRRADAGWGGVAWPVVSRGAADHSPAPHATSHHTTPHPTTLHHTTATPRSPPPATAESERGKRARASLHASSHVPSRTTYRVGMDGHAVKGRQHTDKVTTTAAAAAAAASTRAQAEERKCSRQKRQKRLAVFRSRGRWQAGVASSCAMAALSVLSASCRVVCVCVVQCGCGGRSGGWFGSRLVVGSRSTSRSCLLANSPVPEEGTRVALTCPLRIIHTWLPDGLGTNR